VNSKKLRAGFPHSTAKIVRQEVEDAARSAHFTAAWPVVVASGIDGGSAAFDLTFEDLRQWSPPQITSTQNDYPTFAFNWLIVDLDTDRTLTGLDGPAPGRMVRVTNKSAHTLTLKHEGTGSQAVDRFHCPGDVDYTVGQDSTALAIWDDELQRWRLDRTPGGDSPTYVNVTINYITDIINITNSTVNYYNTTVIINSGTWTYNNVVIFSITSTVWFQGEVEFYLTPVVWSTQIDNFDVQSINGLSISVSGDVDVTGFKPYDVTSSQILFLHNRGPANVLIHHLDASSLAAYRIRVPWANNWYLRPGEGCFLLYDPNDLSGQGKWWLHDSWYDVCSATGDIIYSSDNLGTLARRAIGTAGQVLTVVGGLPVWATPTGGGAGGAGKSWEAYRQRSTAPFAAFNVRRYHLVGLHGTTTDNPTSNDTANAGRLYLGMMIFPGGGTITRIAMGLVGVASKGVFGIWKASTTTNNYPGQKVYNSPELDLSINPNRLHYIDGVNFTPDMNTLYWFGFMVNTNTVVNMVGNTIGSGVLDPLGFGSLEYGAYTPAAPGPFQSRPATWLRADVGYSAVLPDPFPAYDGGVDYGGSINFYGGEGASDWFPAIGLQYEHAAGTAVGGAAAGSGDIGIPAVDINDLALRFNRLAEMVRTGQVLAAGDLKIPDIGTL
jgi:hypothetical protein